MKKNVLAVIIIVIIAAAAMALATPAILGGGWSVKITTVSFTSSVDSTKSPAVQFGSPSFSTSSTTALQYYYAIRSGGSISTTENKVNSTAGNFTGFISWFLINPSNQTISQGNYTFSGGYGNRTHTFTFSADQGVRTTGTYTLVMLLSGTAKALGASPTTIANNDRVAWTVS